LKGAHAVGLNAAKFDFAANDEVDAVFELPFGVADGI
jgi:hypothetical protein